jgi:hypothetical protein
MYLFWSIDDEVINIFETPICQQYNQQQKKKKEKNYKVIRVL